MSNYKFSKAKRTFSFIRHWGWMLTLIIALGGLWFPKLGLIVPFIILAEVLMSIFMGKYWCGNFCPHGSLFDRIILPVSKNIKIPEYLKSRTTITLVFILFIIGFSNRVMGALSYWGEAVFWDRLGFVFVFTYLVVTIIGSLLGIFITPRTWCTFCPMGTMQHLGYKLGKAAGTVKLADKRVTMDSSKCLQCNRCSQVCPMQLQPYPKLLDEEVLTDEECIKCATCVKHCPGKALSLQ